MFRGWDTFYMLIGSVAGALISLLFVVVTLNRGVDRNAAMGGVRRFLTPTVFHFAVVLVVAAIALVPRLPSALTQLAVGGTALWALIYMLTIGRLFMPDKLPDPTHWSDAWCYAIVPAGLYLGLFAADLALGARPDLAIDGIGLAALALLLVSIRNAWDLVIWLAPRGNRDPVESDPAA
jgi:hypothetical protein